MEAGYLKVYRCADDLSLPLSRDPLFDGSMRTPESRRTSIPMIAWWSMYFRSITATATSNSRPAMTIREATGIKAADVMVDYAVAKAKV